MILIVQRILVTLGVGIFTIFMFTASSALAAGDSGAGDSGDSGAGDSGDSGADDSGNSGADDSRADNPGGNFGIITPKCPKGKVWYRRGRKCVSVKKSSMFDDENIYQAGRDLAVIGRFDDAIIVLTNSRNRKDPRVLNYLGYSHRKSGRIDVGLGYYKQALAIDPDYTLVREYMGEAFLQKDEIAKAQNQLNQIEQRCGVECREYVLLSTAISDVLAGRPISDASKGNR